MRLSDRRQIAKQCRREIRSPFVWMEYVICVRIPMDADTEIRESIKSLWGHLKQRADVVQVLEHPMGVRVLGHCNKAARLVGKRRADVTATLRLLVERHRDQSFHQCVEASWRCAEVERRADHKSIGCCHPLEESGHIVGDSTLVWMGRTVLRAQDAARFDRLASDVKELG